MSNDLDNGPNTDQNRRLPESVYRTRRTILLGLGALIAAAITVSSLGDSDQSRFDKVERRALERINGGERDNVAQNEVVVLHEGVKIRSAPLMGEDTNGSKGTVEFEVPNGQVLRVDRPRSYDDLGTEWMSFSMARKGGKEGPISPADDTNVIFWVNMTSLDADTTRPYDTYDYSSGSPNTLKLGVNDLGNLQAVEGDGRQLIATGSLLPTSSFTQLATQEGLKVRGS